MGKTTSMKELARLAFVCLLFASFLTSVLASTSARLHHLLHDDSGTPIHHCLACKLSDGQGDVAPVIAAITAPAGLPRAAVFISQPLFSFDIDPSASPRAPPLLS